MGQALIEFTAIIAVAVIVSLLIWEVKYRLARRAKSNIPKVLSTYEITYSVDNGTHKTYDLVAYSAAEATHAIHKIMIGDGTEENLIDHIEIVSIECKGAYNVPSE